MLGPVKWHRLSTSRGVERPVASIESLCKSFQKSLDLRRAEGESKHPMWSPPTCLTLYSKHHLASSKHSPPGIQSPCRVPTDLTERPLPSVSSTTPRPASDAFMRYRHQPTTFIEAIASDSKLSHSCRLLRKSSISSVNSSPGCSTPSSTPLVLPLHLPSEEIESPFINSLLPFGDHGTTPPLDGYPLSLSITHSFDHNFRKPA